MEERNSMKRKRKRKMKQTVNLIYYGANVHMHPDAKYLIGVTFQQCKLHGRTKNNFQKRVKHNRETSIDDIPKDLIRKIVSYLPILEAGRSSILSTSWRNQWKNLPVIIFDDSTIPEPMRGSIISIVNRVFSQHLGPIDKFEYHNLPVMEPNLDEWFLQLCRKNIKVLRCAFVDYNAWFDNSRWILPPIFFSCIQLVQAELHFFEIKVPDPFNSFDNLVTLHLENVIIKGDEFRYLIARCPLLQKLVFRNFSGCAAVKFSAPNLRELEISGPFDDVYFENTPQLAIFSVTKSGPFYTNDFLDPYNLIKSLAGTPELESLKFGVGMMEFMIFGNGVSGLPVLLHLKRLHIEDINLQNEFEMEILCCLLQSCPSLEEVIVDADSHTDVEDVDHQSLCDGDGWASLRFNNLKYFYNSDYAAACDLALIRLLFANAPLMERFRLGMDLEEAVTHGIYEHINKLSRPGILIQIGYE